MHVPDACTHIKMHRFAIYDFVKGRTQKLSPSWIYCSLNPIKYKCVLGEFGYQLIFVWIIIPLDRLTLIISIIWLCS